MGKAARRLPDPPRLTGLDPLPTARYQRDPLVGYLRLDQLSKEGERLLPA